MRQLGALLTVALAAAMSAGAAAGATITEFTAGLGPSGVAKGADGNVWFADAPNPGAVGRVTPGGTVTTFTAGLTRDAQPKGIAGTPTGVWFTENGKNVIGRVAPDGTITEFTAGMHDHPSGIAGGPDGNVWYALSGKHGAIGRITPAGVVTEYASAQGLTNDGNPADIALGPDGNLWFTEPGKRLIGRITPQGAITEFDATGFLAGGTPQQIAAGPDGNVWFTVNGTAPAIGRITPTGAITAFTSGLPVNSSPTGIDAGADGAVYFADAGANAIGRITPSGTITEVSAGLTPSANLQGVATGGDGRVWVAESGKAKVARLTVAPGVERVSESSVTQHDADVSSAVSSNSEATTYRFEWGTSPGASDGGVSAWQSVSATGGGTPQAVAATLPVLTASTTYYVRVVASNGSGTTVGPESSFTTPDVGKPSATSLPATDVSATGATLNATVNPEGSATTYHFAWGRSTGYGSVAPVSDAPLGAGTSAVPAAVSLSGLEAHTTYHFQIVATSSGGTTYGADQTFTTDAVAPQATTSSATGVTADSATLAGEVDPGHSATTYRFEWGTTDGYGSSIPLIDALVGDDHVTHPVTEQLSGLAPSTTYHFRVVATNNAGVTAGGDRQFTTAGVPPAAATAAADAITSTTATVHAAVNPYNDPATTFRFEWGATAAYGQRTADVSVDGAIDQTSRGEGAAITGLAPGSTYHFRVVATSSSGTTTGQDASFTTAPAGSDTASPAPPSGPRPVPQLGRTAVASVVVGKVLVRVPDSTRAVPVSEAVAIPSGSVVDARRGTLLLDSAVDSRGRRQAARFRGAIFRVALARKGGMVDLTLTQRPAGCSRTRGAVRAAAARKKRAPVSLWGKDSKGKYRTHGRNSVATVRGTEWFTTETCAGTLTRVVKGAVSVRDLHARRTRLVRAGHRYLAHAAR